jgi:hypothetical protein
LRREGFQEPVIEAVAGLTKRDGEEYDAFVQRAARNPVSRVVKKADLEDNMDMRRLKVVTEKDIERLQRYHRNWCDVAVVDELLSDEA